jgi:hypothetical protein
MGWACGTYGGEERCIQGFLGRPVGKKPLRKLGSRLLKQIFSEWDVGVWTGSIWLRIGTGGGLLLMR